MSETELMVSAGLVSLINETTTVLKMHGTMCFFMFSTHLSMTPLGARGSSHSSWAEREVRVTGRGGGWWAGGAARVWSSLSGPWLQHCQMFKTETSKIYSISECTSTASWMKNYIHRKLFCN